MLFHVDADQHPAMRAALQPGQYAFVRRSDLRQAGMTPARIARAVKEGILLRPRNGVYLHPEAPANARVAAGIGGKVGCVSALHTYGVFVSDRRASAHIHVEPRTTRLGKVPEGVTVHWNEVCRRPDPRSTRVELIDALIQSTVCQEARAAIASLDSALNLGLIDTDDLDEIFRRVPRRRRILRSLIDGRAESGSETYLRLMLRSLGLSFECQVEIAGVGRVDFVVEGWLIVECDSREHHSSWEQQQEDRRRDLASATLGYATLRPTAADIFAGAPVISLAIGTLAGLRPYRDGTPD